MISLPPYPILSVIHPRIVHDMNAHDYHFWPCARCVTRATPKSAMNAALAASKGRWSKILAVMGHVSSVQLSKADIFAEYSKGLESELAGQLDERKDLS
jgi:hypothetical protein